jgi:hypothetical protein
MLTSLVVALLGLSASAQQQSESCEMPFDYENRNQVDPKPLSIEIVSGRVIVESEELDRTMKERGPVPGACLGLFTEEDHRLVATAVADDEGRFTFSTVPSGNYRLLVRATPLCVANIRVRVVRSKRGTENERKQIVVHMQAAWYDSCSYGDYK